MIGIVERAAKAGDEALVVGAALCEFDGVAEGVSDSLTDGCGIGVSVTTGAGALRTGSEVSVQPKKLERIKTVPTAPIIRFVLLGDLKLDCLNGTV